MEARNRDRIRDPREEILLETNFDDDGVMTRAYNNNKVNQRRSVYRSDYSIDRFSEASLHGNNHKSGKNLIFFSLSVYFRVCFVINRIRTERVYLI